MLELEILTVQ